MGLQFYARALTIVYPRGFTRVFTRVFKRVFVHVDFNSFALMCLHIRAHVDLYVSKCGVTCLHTRTYTLLHRIRHLVTKSPYKISKDKQRLCPELNQTLLFPVKLSCREGRRKSEGGKKKGTETENKKEKSMAVDELICYNLNINLQRILC